MMRDGLQPLVVYPCAPPTPPPAAAPAGPALVTAYEGLAAERVGGKKRLSPATSLEGRNATLPPRRWVEETAFSRHVV